MSKAGISIPMGLLDGTYWTTDAKGWSEVLSRLVASPFAYKDEVNDCEDIALEAMVACSREYGLNTLGMAIGNSPQGRHAFNLFLIDGIDLWVFEPQDVMGIQYFPLGEQGYTVDMLLI